MGASATPTVRPEAIAARKTEEAAAALEASAKQKVIDTETDAARLASGQRKLTQKRVYDLGRVRNRSVDYEKPTLGTSMTGARKTLLGQ